MSSDDQQDLYDIVGVPRTATIAEIRRAYRQKARTIHPDVSDDPDSAEAFRRLVDAFETLIDTSKRGAYESQRKRQSARSRAQAQWDSVNKRASSGGSAQGAAGSAASERPAGSRREAEARSREDSERRRERWRGVNFEEIWREHMPLSYAVSEAQRAAFVASLEVAVQSFVRKQGGGESGTAASEPDGGSRAADHSSTQSEAEEVAEICRSSNREVLRAELADAKHRATKHRERARWLEAELALSSKKASMWRGATPGTETDRVNAMSRELEWLELTRRYRERLALQRVAIEQLKNRERAIENRLVELRNN